MEIIDNYLDQKEFNEIQDVMMGPGFEWFYSPAIDDEKELQQDTGKFQFTHMFHFDFGPQSPHCKILRPILKTNLPVAIWRIKANLLTKTPEIVENKFHIDIGDLPDYKLKHWTTSIFYINTNNGYTKFEDGTIVESVANRMVTFPSNLKHTGTSCTDEKVRIVLNFDFFANDFTANQTGQK